MHKIRLYLLHEWYLETYDSPSLEVFIRGKLQLAFRNVDITSISFPQGVCELHFESAEDHIQATKMIENSKVSLSSLGMALESPAIHTEADKMAGGIKETVLAEASDQSEKEDLLRQMEDILKYTDFPEAQIKGAPHGEHYSATCDDSCSSVCQTKKQSNDVHFEQLYDF